MIGKAWGRVSRSPGASLVLVAHLLLLCFAADALVARAMPEFGITAADRGATVAFDVAGAGRLSVPRAQPVTIASTAGAMTVPAVELLPDFTPPGDRGAVARFFADRDRLLAIARSPVARIILGRPPRTAIAPLRARRRTLADLPLNFWLLAIQGVAIGLLGWWLRLTAPATPGARMFSLSCDGVLLAAMAGAVYDARSLAADGTLLWCMQLLNMVGTNLCATGLMGLFLYLPRPLAPSWVGAAAMLLAAAIGLAEGSGLLSLAWFYLLLIVPNIVLLGAVAMQWRASHAEPKARAVIRLIGASTFAGAALLCGAMVAPALFDVPSVASDGAAIVPLALIYGSIAFGIAGTRLFVLDLWSYLLALGAATALALLAADALIARLLDVERPVALVIALLAIGYAYLPLRSWIWQRITNTQALSRETLVRQTALVAFAADPKARHAGWRALLERVFAPLEMLPGGTTDRVAIELAGETLHIPVTPDCAALRLRYARGGTRLFSPADADVARELVDLVRAASAARNSYMTGVQEERQRIARDLHDDVSGLLLSGLHRADIALVREDLHQAMTEIRSMVSSLADGARSLDHVLADIRHEMATRLAAVQIELVWDLSASPAFDVDLDYGRARTLTASLRESVTNVVKHARASRLSVGVTRDGDTLSLVVADNGGTGAGGVVATGSGRGLRNIRLRLAEIGGTCRFEAAPTGFTMRLTMPLAAER